MKNKLTVLICAMFLNHGFIRNMILGKGLNLSENSKKQKITSLKVHNLFI